MKYAFCCLLAFCSGAVWAQTTGGTSTGAGSAPPAGSTGGTTAPGAGRTIGPIAPTTPSTTTKPPYETAHPVFISGKVITEDGSPVPTNITIQRVCNGNARSVAYADSKGRFNFQWGQTQGVMMDASEPGYGSRSGGLSSGSGSSQLGSGMGGGLGGDSSGPSMNGCELRASIVGYRSESVNLFNRNGMDNPDVGTILIHRMGNVEGTSISVTSMLAPKDAKKAYDRGLQSLLKNRTDDAGKDFEKAVDVYPKYAEAWVNLGKVRIM
ncbi:MAG: carboxypeptidase-like regulatory domain-containing protein, partial [Acidobacteriota bacterium]|nr:carboxypeptidase-like regulatory domain-containing protein [Acidobacteriota bacterium]